jgi:alcohol dehydrogenase
MGLRSANIGVHGKPVQLNLDKLWDHNITITTRLVDTVTIPMLLAIVNRNARFRKKSFLERKKHAKDED